MSLFDRYLSVWVALCIITGIVLAMLLPGLFATLAALEYASVNLVVAVLIWAMVYPMMVRGRPWRAEGRRSAAKGPDHYRGGELADKALHHGGPWCAVF